MPKSNALDTAVLSLIFNATPIANLADDAASAPLINLYLSLHTASPGADGSQLTNEIGYTSYARVPVSRSGAGWVVTGGSVSPASTITFPTSTGGSGTATHFAIGSASSGAGVVYYFGTITPNIVVSTIGITPQLTQASTITEA